MNSKDMLAKLVAQAGCEGEELITLRAIVEEASEIGADRALNRLGLADENAQDDLDELRELLDAWRIAKASAWKAAVDWLVRAALAALLIGIAMRMDVAGLLK